MATFPRLTRKLLAANRMLKPSVPSSSVLHSCNYSCEPAKTTTSPPTTIFDRVKWDYRGQRRIIPLGQWVSKIAVDAYVAPNVVLAGQVTVNDGASVEISIKLQLGFCSNVQERCVIHAAWSSPTGLLAETSFERYVTIGAYSLEILHDRTQVHHWTALHSYGRFAGSVVPPGRRIPTGQIWAGNPARFIRILTYSEMKEIPKLAMAINDLKVEVISQNSCLTPRSTCR